MPVTANAPAPYGPPKNVLDLIQRHRSKGLPSPINADVLQRAGVSDSLIPRTLQTLQALDLINEDGSPSTVLEGLRLAPEDQYQQRLRDWLNATYADALAFVDPAVDGDVKVRDAFRNYRPVGQQSRMVTLFTTLFAAAGVGPEKKAQPSRATNGATRRPSNPQPRSATPPLRRADGHSGRDKGSNNTGGGNAATSLPSPISGLLTKLPPEDEGWTKGEREKFLAAFEAILDFCYPLIEQRQKAPQQPTEEDEE